MAMYYNSALDSGGHHAGQVQHFFSHARLKHLHSPSLLGPHRLSCCFRFPAFELPTTFAFLHFHLFSLSHSQSVAQKAFICIVLYCMHWIVSIKCFNPSYSVPKAAAWHPNSTLKSVHISTPSVMSWGRTEGVPRFYIFGKDSASAYVLRHQTSTVLEFRVRDRRGFGGSDGEFEGQSMLISD